MSIQGTSTAQGAIGGAGQLVTAGAAVGSFGGPVGTVIGGAIGAVVGAIGGGVGGFMSGKKKKKAEKYAKMAAAIQQQREAEAYKQNLLSQIRQARITRASMLATTVAAGAEEGSGSQGALSSYGSQTANIVEYMSVDRGRAIDVANYTARAKKNLSTAQAIDTTTNGIIQLGSSIAQAYASYKGNMNAQQEGLKQSGGYRFNADNSLTLGEGMPYLDSGKVQYVPSGKIINIG